MHTMHTYMPVYLPCSLTNALQIVKATCLEHTQHVIVLPLDLCGSHGDIHAAAAQADKAFGDVGIDYMIHNAGGWVH